MSVSENVLNFNEIERCVQKMCNELGCEMLKTILENWDRDLAEQRDRTEYRHKEKRKTVIKTILGEVVYERSVYETRNPEGIKELRVLTGQSDGDRRRGLSKRPVVRTNRTGEL